MLFHVSDLFAKMTKFIFIKAPYKETSSIYKPYLGSARIIIRKLILMVLAQEVAVNISSQQDTYPNKGCQKQLQPQKEQIVSGETKQTKVE